MLPRRSSPILPPSFFTYIRVKRKLGYWRLIVVVAMGYGSVTASRQLVGTVGKNSNIKDIACGTYDGPTSVDVRTNKRTTKDVK